MRPMSRRRGEDALWMAQADELRRDRARRDAARDRRLRDLPPPARERRLGARADADGARRRSRTASPASTRAPTTIWRSRSRSRSCSRVCGPCARRGAVERPTCSRSARSASILRRARSGAATRRSRCRRRSSRCSRPSCAGRRGAVALPAARARLGLRLRNRSNVVDVYVRYLRDKIDRPFGIELDRDGARRRLPAARGRRMLSASADPDPADAGSSPA